MDNDLRPVDPGICLPNLTLTPEHASNLAAALLKAVHEIRCLGGKGSLSVRIMVARGGIDRSVGVSMRHGRPPQRPAWPGHWSTTAPILTSAGLPGAQPPKCISKFTLRSRRCWRRSH